jgi:hypothetical protein
MPGDLQRFAGHVMNSVVSIWEDAPKKQAAVVYVFHPIGFFEQKCSGEENPRSGAPYRQFSPLHLQLLSGRVTLRASHVLCKVNHFTLPLFRILNPPKIVHARRYTDSKASHGSGTQHWFYSKDETSSA